MSMESGLSSKPKTLVLCFDGTSEQYDSYNTNVVKFYSLLKKDDPNKQMTYYQAGVGTWFNPGVVSPLFTKVAQLLDAAFAWYLDAHVLDGYRFLMQNYNAGDRLCFFGFSRGAYAARALAGFLHKVGLLPSDNQEQIMFAYKLYKREDPEGLTLAAGFKQTFCRSVQIQFMGMWDTVASVGVIMTRTLPFTNANSSIKVFRHALSLDEHRVRFEPKTYYPLYPLVPSTSESQRDLGEAEAQDNFASSITLQRTKKKKIFSRGWQSIRRSSTRHLRPRLMDSDDICPDVREVWFAGSHEDVGGGHALNSDPHHLSNVSLRWMVRQAMAAHCGIRFDMDALERASTPIQNPTPSAGESRSIPGEAELDYADALQPFFDPFKANLLWWILEILPIYTARQDSNGVSHSGLSIHLGRGRKIRDPHPRFHTTVRERMDTEALHYSPKARWEVGSEVYVE